MKLPYAAYLVVIGPCINISLVPLNLHRCFKSLVPNRPPYPHHLLPEERNLELPPVKLVFQILDEILDDHSFDFAHFFEVLTLQYLQ